MHDALCPVKYSTVDAKPKRKHRVRRLLTIVLIGFSLWLIVACGLQRQVLFPRWAMPNAPAIDPAQDVEVISIDTDDGPVPAWFIPGDGQTPENPAPVVIFAHGNAERIEDWDPGLRGYTRRGVGVLLPEFRGYGQAPGSPSQKNIVADHVAFYDLIAARDDVDPTRIIVHGRSVGGGFSAQLAAQRPTAAMILQSTFISAAKMAQGYSVPRVLMRDPLDVEAVLKDYENPVLLIHGRHDEVIPPRHAEANHARRPRQPPDLVRHGPQRPAPDRGLLGRYRRFPPRNRSDRLIFSGPPILLGDCRPARDNEEERSVAMQDLRNVLAAMGAHLRHREMHERDQPLPFITISQQAGVDLTELVPALVERLNAGLRGEPRWTGWERELIERAAADHQLSDWLIETITDRDHSMLRQMFEGLSFADGPPLSEEAIYRRVATTIRAVADLGRAVMVGLGSVYVTRDKPMGLHVGLVAPLEERAKFMAEREGVDEFDGRDRVLEIDHNRAAFYRQHFPLAPTGADLFHVTFNVAEVPADAIAEAIDDLLPRVTADRRSTQLV